MGRPKGSKNKPKSPGRTLTELAQNLVDFCVANGTDTDVALELRLPKTVLDQVSLSFKPKENVTLDSNPSTMSKLYLTGGTLELKTTETTVGV